jgi:hypothetical protein
MAIKHNATCTASGGTSPISDDNNLCEHQPPGTVVHGDKAADFAQPEVNNMTDNHRINSSVEQPSVHTSGGLVMNDIDYLATCTDHIEYPVTLHEEWQEALWIDGLGHWWIRNSGDNVNAVYRPIMRGEKTGFPDALSFGFVTFSRVPQSKLKIDGKPIEEVMVTEGLIDSRLYLTAKGKTWLTEASPLLSGLSEGQ